VPAAAVAVLIAGVMTGVGTGAPAAQTPAPVAVSVAPRAPAPGFAEWIAGVRREAERRGITAATLDAALNGLEALPVVVERDRSQAEQTLSLDRYLARRLTPTFVATARLKAREHRALLRRAESAYGVPRNVVAAIWGLESNFGRFTGSRPTIPALATLAHEGRRADLFREELFAALAIVDAGDVSVDRLRGSWAGALGQPQFMPSAYRSDAVDFDGDGRRDIWSSTADVLGSIANYLNRRGWVIGHRWGREVALPDAARRRAADVPLRMTGGCRAVRDMTEPRALGEWALMGVTLPGRGPLPTAAVEASLVRIDGRTFLVYRNYETLLAYNCAHTYALSVALLADRLPSIAADTDAR